jgi:hypothetical protein
MTGEAETTAELRRYFAAKLSALRGCSPQAYWAARYGLTAGAVRDLEQGRVLPSRAVVILLHAIAAESVFMQQIAKAAKEDLALLDEVRRGSN